MSSSEVGTTKECRKGENHFELIFPPHFASKMHVTLPQIKVFKGKHYDSVLAAVKISSYIYKKYNMNNCMKSKL